jgi:hypothetical protein
MPAIVSILTRAAVCDPARLEFGVFVHSQLARTPLRVLDVGCGARLRQKLGKSFRGRHTFEEQKGPGAFPVAGARYGPISDLWIPLESWVEWPTSTA